MQVVPSYFPPGWQSAMKAAREGESRRCAAGRTRDEKRQIVDGELKIWRAYYHLRDAVKKLPAFLLGPLEVACGEKVSKIDLQALQVCFAYHFATAARDAFCGGGVAPRPRMVYRRGLRILSGPAYRGRS